MNRLQSICRFLWNDFRNFVTSRKDVTAFLLCLALTCFIWFFHAMNHRRSPEVTVNLVYTGVPDNVNLQNLPAHLQMEISDVGRNLYANRANNSIDTVHIDLSPYIGASSSGRIRISQSDLEELLKDSLPGTAKIVSIRPQYITGYYTREASHQVPVVLQGDVTAAEQYILSQRPTISPAMVHIYGPETMLDTISCIYTVPFQRLDLKDTLNIALRLQVPKGCQVKPSTVQLRAIASQFTEKRFKLPVEVINAPVGTHVKPLPSEVDVVCNVSLANYKTVSESDIHVILDYSLNDETGKILLNARYSPDIISNVRLTPSQVDYILE